MPARTPVLALIALWGCAAVDAEVYDEPMAVDLDADGCLIGSGDPVPVGNAFTVELWVRPADPPQSERAALVVLGEAAMLYADANATGLAAPAEQPTTGWQTGTSIYDGEVHHVAATWSELDGGNIFIDGVRSGTGEAWAVIPALDEIAIGCWPDEGRPFDGVVDEIRISTVIRYPTNFQLPDGPFQLDADTLALWHLDDGVGDIALDRTDRYPAVFVGGAEWTAPIVGAPEDTGG